MHGRQHTHTHTDIHVVDKPLEATEAPTKRGAERRAVPRGVVSTTQLPEELEPAGAVLGSTEQWGVT